MALRDPKATEKDIEAGNGTASEKAKPSLVTIYPALHRSDSDDPSTPSTICSLQKPEPFDSSQPDLRFAKTLHYLRLTRILIRVTTACISIASFSTILYTLIIYLHHIRGHTDSQHAPPPPWLRPESSFTFAGISFVALLVNLALCLATGLSAAIREISNFSNSVLAFAGVGSFSGLIAGCVNMHVQWGKQDLWEWACYKATQEATEYDKSFKYRDVCHFTTTSWNLGIVQAAFEMVIVINVFVAALILRRERLKRMSRYVPGLR